MALKEPNYFVWNDKLTEDSKELMVKLNASLQRLNELRAVEINVSEQFLRSKIAWKLATYHHALLHRIVALVDGIALAWNNRCTLSAILSARALMETFAVLAALANRVADLLAREELGQLDEYVQQAIFASRDPAWCDEYPESQAISVLTYIDKFDKEATGFRKHYDALSERCHPNSLGHNFMFSKLDRSDGSVRYFDERNPEQNAKMILTAVWPLLLVEPMLIRLDELTLEVADLQHRVSPVGPP